MYLNKVIDFLTIIIIVVLTIRNIFEGVGPYEGPVMQHTFGTHTYFIFYLIAPLLTFFKDPKILILINISSVFLSSILLYFISRRILNRYDKFKCLNFKLK